MVKVADFGSARNYDMPLACEDFWEVTKTGDPPILSQIVGFPYNEDPNKVPLISETPLWSVQSDAVVGWARFGTKGGKASMK